LLILATIAGVSFYFVNKNRQKQKLAKIETEKKLAEIEENNRKAEEENKRMLREQEEKFKKENEAQRLKQQKEKEQEERDKIEKESLSRLHKRSRVPSLVDLSGNVFSIDSLVVKVGRIDGNDLVIDDKTVSRSHAVIMYERMSPDALPTPSNEFYILDLGSANGTFVNHSPVTGAVKIKDGDLLRFGNISANFRC
jgi:DNA polymerase III alpha subunit (gram-positive type)